MVTKTEQERFWKGEFGHEYSKRNVGENILSSNLSLFSRILQCTDKIESICELGANIGLNIMALKYLLPKTDFSCIEINEYAHKELSKIDGLETINESILDFKTDKKWDLALIKTVLIHINPEYLNQVYDLLYSISMKYIVIAEYYNPSPVSVVYRGNQEKLFKRDFAGEMLDKFSDLELLDYGFAYHRDTQFPQDDITWFLLRKK